MNMQIENTDNNISMPVWKNKPLAWALMLLALALLGFTASDSLQEMVRIWEVKEEYSHGYLIPFITLFLIWQKSEILRFVEFKGAWSALIVLLIGIALILIGVLTTIRIVSLYGAFVALVGLVASYTGWRGLRPILVPLVLLLFMLPLPGFFLNNLSAKLQLVSSELGVAVIRMFDISVYLEGNVIDLGQYKLQVVEACSGLRYLFPLMSLAFIAAYFFQAAFWKRAVIFLSSIPITILMNSFRIGVIGVLVEYWGIEQAEGFIHDFEGWAVFMACLGILIGEMWLFSRFSSDQKSLREVFGIEFPEPIPGSAELRYQQLSTPFIASIIFLFGAAVLSHQTESRKQIIPDRSLFSVFPDTLDGWRGNEDRLEQIYLDALKLDDYIISDYVSADGHRVNLYVAYYESQQAGEAAHSPRSCLPGGGWVIKDLSQKKIEGVEINGKPLSVNRVVIRKGDHTQVVYYWFQQRGRDITNEYLVKWYLLVDALMKSRTDGSLIRLTTVVEPGEDIADAEKALEEFTGVLIPALDDFIPN